MSFVTVPAGILLFLIRSEYVPEAAATAVCSHPFVLGLITSQFLLGSAEFTGKPTISNSFRYGAVSTPWLALTVINELLVTVLVPAELVVLSVTLYTPGVGYVTTGFCEVEVAGVPPGNAHW